jgi:hypothetical protein
MWAMGGHEKAHMEACVDRSPIHADPVLAHLGREWVGPPPPSIWVHPLVCLLPKFMSARTRLDSRLGQPTGDAVRSSGRSRLLVPQAQNNNRRFFFHSGLYRNCSTGEEHRCHHHGDECGSCGTHHGGLYDKATTEESSHQLGRRAATHCGAACL